MRPVLLSAFTMTSCLGAGLAPVRRALREGASGLAPCRFESVELETFVGEIAGVDETRLPAGLARFDCRNNRAAELGLAHERELAELADAFRTWAAHPDGWFTVLHGEILCRP